MIETFDLYEDLFKEISSLSKKDINFYVIGGAVLLYRDLKPSTKDIDIVVNTKSEFEELVKVLSELGFNDYSPKLSGYDHFKIAKKLKKDDFHIDLFLKEVCSKFSFSKDMIIRSEEIMSFNRLKTFLCSNEDVFCFKTMTERPGDLEDCISLAQRGLDWDVIFEEILSQIEFSGKDVWITWINERLLILEKKGVNIPILGKIEKLVVTYMESLDLK